jgi:hypothetical protein
MSQIHLIPTVELVVLKNFYIPDIELKDYWGQYFVPTAQKEDSMQLR